ncbi:MAG: DNA polymerase III subunit alpha [Planctomycetota bacterium]|nr:MAG: DNA polymerase III subunit alpha [Planctomycetota bacterium]
MEPFVHLHVHSEYSLLDGANRISDLVQAAVADGHQALALTDHGNLYGAVEFYKECRKAGIKPLLGCEVYVARGSMHRKHHRIENPYWHLTLIARTGEGWKNLMKLATAAHLEGQHFRPRIDLERLAGHARGLICLSGCMSGPVNRCLRDGDEEGALAMAGRLQEMFGREHFFLEVMRNGLAEQDRLTEGMVRLQPRLGAPLIATNDIHYLRQEDCEVQDALICLHQNTKLDDPDRWRLDSETLFFRSREQMNRIFADLPGALRTTLDVAEQVEVELELGRHRLPRFVPDDGGDPDQLFERLCEEGFARRYPGNPPAARERLEYEKRVIREMGFVSYFLIVWDLIRYARSQGIPVGPGRGSAAGSVVAYCLGITRIDPLRYDLIFERFLNSSRISMPDIDIDFCKDRREEMLAYTRRRYGDENVCQIITFGKLKAKNALRDMARVLDLPLAEVNQAAKKVPDGPGVRLREVLDREPELAEIGRTSDRHRKWFELAQRVEGLSRNAGVHAAGVIIADQPLAEIVPLSRLNDATTTQWDMKVCEEVGLLKMDFLGLRTLTILEDAVRMVRERGSGEIDLAELPLDDPEVYALLQAADTEGVFQLESAGMRRLLAELRPDCFEDLIAVLALFRPGPLGSGLHQTYARRKHGQEQVSYPHPLLEEVLRETYGVLIYQEQIMRVAQKMGGFSLNEADTLRKAMGKKKRELMEPFERPFLAGAAERGVSEETAREVWEMMVKFAEYGFNKSHSAAYALVTYQAAWLKVHHPAEFYASSFTHEAADSDKLRVLLEDARRHGIALLPPCVRVSGPDFTVTADGAVRFGLAAVKGVGRGAAEVLVELRAARPDGPWHDLQDLYVDAASRGLNRTTLESLIKAGAMDSFGRRRLDLLEDLETSLAAAQARAKDRATGQDWLFAAGPAPADPTPAAAAGEASSARLRPLSDEERRRTLALEKEALGLYLTRHPLDPYREVLPGVSPWNSRNLVEAPDRGQLTLAGIATMVEIRGTRKDPARKYARLRIEDLYGSVAAVAWPSTWERHREQLVEDFVGLFTGVVEHGGDSVTFQIESIQPLGERDRLRLEGSLELQLAGERPPLEEIAGVLRRHPGPSPVRFRYTAPDGRERRLRCDGSWGVTLDAALLDRLAALLGREAVRVLPPRRRATPAPEPRWRRQEAART